MFNKIWQFEIGCQFRRPTLYIYFLAILLFTIFTFATGSLPLTEKEHINAPYAIALWCAVMSMVISVAGSSVMGLPLYRDIEYRTKDYYLTYPVTPAGYFWGRYLGALLCMLFIAGAIPGGIYLGTKLGPLAGWKDSHQYGPDHLSYFLQPFFCITVPNLLFTSSLFFGLVALTRNVKVIYSGGVILFLTYFLSFFFLFNDHSGTVVDLADPFTINGVLLQSHNASSLQKNTSVITVNGNFFINRIIWTLLGLGILLFAYGQFKFESFFRFKGGKVMEDDAPALVPASLVSSAGIRFSAVDNRRILLKLIRIELTNLLRDHYFWIILASGLFFLLFSFWLGVAPFGVPELPRTVLLFSIFNDTFPFYFFIFILFYTGEILYRERATRFAAINDALPPPNWVLGGAKLVTLLLLGTGIALMPAFGALFVQITKGFHQFDYYSYAEELFILLIPRMLQMVVFCYVVHVLVNHKFAAHAIAGLIWVGLFFLQRSGMLNYHLLLYSYTPGYQISEMDGLGHMLKPIAWFNFYWLICAALLIVLAALFFYRGVTSSFKERLTLVSQRFSAKISLITVVLFIAFLCVGGFIYYNISYLNNYLTANETEARQVMYEKTLKPLARLPLPKITSIRLFVDLYPGRQQAFTRAWVTIANKTDKPITQLLVDGEKLAAFSVKLHGKPIAFTYPLNYHRGAFNLFRPESEPAEFRLYRFARPLVPGDSLQLEVSSTTMYTGFQNDVYAQDILHNGTCFNGGLPNLGYDPGDELADPFERKKNHLPEKSNAVFAQNDPAGFNTLRAGPTAYLFNLDITVSTDSDQTAIAPGQLQKQWHRHGRTYFHYCQSNPGTYMPFTIISARYAILHDTAMLNHPVDIAIYYLSQHNTNIHRFLAAYKDGLHYFSKTFGRYPFGVIRLTETSIYQSKMTSFTTLTGYNEDFGWNAGFNNPNQFDYCYFTTARALAQQWWRFQVAPNNTLGSLIISQGLSAYSALMLVEKKYGPQNMRDILRDQIGEYLFRRTRLEEREQPLAGINQPYLDGKAGVVLYGLKCLIGEDSINAALRDFKNAYALKTRPPFAGNNDLLYYLQKRVPDSLKYYLVDNWQNITFYDNKIIRANAVPTANKNIYKVMVTVNCAKSHISSNGNDVPAKHMNDMIAIGVFGNNSLDKNGRWQTNPVYLKTYKLCAGQHTLAFFVNGKPAYAGIDPFAILMDRNGNDNLKTITYSASGL
ncbi:ABC transporter permease/M1 family aminopeptidase [Chitinophaga ginsengisoli]|uniref:ABC-type transport system involved in multi-copper enzyme maturation permease subunit n=1 Tax=Chitinophaga ginsengisoli TaxID=363837 RepID=A0A2P8GAR5_9BACT|nr:hypothetical protein [Chitinophaga ginsengisoli]PSL31038.1 ABC-type transport system involved in multi-copper enzyme maturation permease subunit [Chitinophaga ginsengisoli]